MKRRRQLIVALAMTLGIGIAGVLAAYKLSSQVVSSADLSEFSASGVQVDLSVEQTNNGACVLAAQYTPLREHFHVYSKDLPANGIDGLGRPTRLDIVSGLISEGALTASAEPIDLKTEGLDEILPVYPDGAVTLRLPVKVLKAGNAQVKVSYMACSTFACLDPTTKILDVDLSKCNQSLTSS